LMLAAGVTGFTHISLGATWYFPLGWAGFYVFLMLLFEFRWKKRGA
jgi:hypothetical protein